MIYDKKNGSPVYTVKMTANKIFPIMFSAASINAFGASCDYSIL